MTISSFDFDADALIHELSASLLPSQRHAFIDAAHQALQGVSCLGPGLAFRLLAEIQRRHFEPPDLRSDMLSARHQRSKLRDGPPIGPATREDRARRAMFQRPAG